MMEHAVPTESELLQGARQLDAHSLSQIYDLHSPGLYRYALRRLGDPSMAEECLSETFSRLLNALHAGRGPRDHLQAYLYRTAHNWIVDHYRRRPAAEEELSNTIEDTKPGPEELTGKHLQQQHLRGAIQKLTPEQQQVIALKYLEGWKNKEIAYALKRTIGSVKSLQHRALASLERILAEEDL